jgi:BolA protein
MIFLGEKPVIWEERQMKKGPAHIEMEMLLEAAFEPSRLSVINDSARHHGHSGDDGSGESHFAIEIESALFTGVSRLTRQRMGWQ